MFIFSLREKEFVRYDVGAEVIFSSFSTESLRGILDVVVVLLPPPPPPFLLEAMTAMIQICLQIKHI